MLKTLMHKDTEVCSLKFRDDDIIESIKAVQTPELIFGEENAAAFVKRLIYLRNPYGLRKDIAEIKGFYSPSKVKTESFRSLLDCYWIRSSSEQKWEDINPYESYTHDQDSVFLALIRPEELEGFFLDSPNLTIPGKERKFWYREQNGNLSLLYGAAQREMTIKKTAIEAGIEDVLAPREYVFINSNIFVKSPAQTSENIELIPFTYLYESVQDEQKSMVDNITACCEKYEIPNWRQFFSKMANLDKLIGKTDREFWEVGVLRNTDTLKYEGFAKL